MNGIIKQRIKKIFNELDDDISHILINNSIEKYIDSNFFYLTGIKSGMFEDSFAVASRDGNLTILTSALEAETAKAADIDVKINDGEWSTLPKLFEGSKKIGINYYGTITDRFFRLGKLFGGNRLIDISRILDEMRMIKDESEIRLLRRSAKIVSSMFESLKSEIRAGLKETEVSAIIDYNMMKNGASSTSFSTICGTGKNSAEPHHSPEETKIRKSDFIVCDFGARYGRYCSDFTRTFVIGKGNKKQRSLYETVLAAQTNSLNAIKPGVTGKEIYKTALKTIEDGGYKGRFTHGIGHALGLDVHDSSTINPFGDNPLKENMVLTVEPGIYIPRYGGVRIEDDIIVTKKGYELLTIAPKKWADITIEK